MHHPTDRITHTTVFVTPVVENWLERKIAQWVHPMKNRSDDPSHHERTLVTRDFTVWMYISVADPGGEYHFLIFSDILDLSSAYRYLSAS